MCSSSPTGSAISKGVVSDSSKRGIIFSSLRFPSYAKQPRDPVLSQKSLPGNPFAPQERSCRMKTADRFAVAAASEHVIAVADQHEMHSIRAPQPAQDQSTNLCAAAKAANLIQSLTLVIPHNPKNIDTRACCKVACDLHCAKATGLKTNQTQLIGRFSAGWLQPAVKRSLT